MRRILIVDDEKSIRTTLCEFLKRDGYEAEEACDAQEALGMLYDGRTFDVIVTDIIMPRVSGIELIEKIRAVSKTAQIIVMTGEPTVDTAIKAVQSGANDYLTKPIRRDDFLRVVRQAMNVVELVAAKAELEKQNQLYQKDLEELVQKRTDELLRAMQSIVSLLSTVVEARDPYTAGHQKRVGNLAAAIAQKMGEDTKTVEYLRIIGYIHDIGKIVIPSEILSKTGTLSGIEMQLIQNHSAQGYEMLSKVDLPELIAETIYQHHERCDGSGYPRALKEGEILKEAQFIMVADVVEAMTSHRPYRPALGLTAALREIQDNAGTLYREDVVRSCVELFEQDHYEIDNTEYSVYFPL